MSQDGFFSRWSKRKLADTPDPVTAPVAQQADSKAAAQPIAESTKSPVGGQIEAKMPENARQSGTLGVAAPSEQPDPLPAIASMNPQSDFSPFMAKDVSPELRNQAMKLLFTDPHYNVMDRLDIYIDDYGIPDPLPPDWLRKMNQSKALRLFDDEETAEQGEQATASISSTSDDAGVADNTPPEPPTEEPGAKVAGAASAQVADAHLDNKPDEPVAPIAQELSANAPLQ